MIEGVINKANVEKMPTTDTQRRNNVQTDRKQNEEIINSENTKPVENSSLYDAVERIVNAAKMFDRKINLEVDQETNTVIVKVIDPETDEVVRQIPPEEILELSRNSKDLTGLLLSVEG